MPIDRLIEWCDISASAQLRINTRRAEEVAIRYHKRELRKLQSRVLYRREQKSRRQKTDTINRDTSDAR